MPIEALLSMLLVLAPLPASADDHVTLPIQGILRDDEDNLVENEHVTMTFRLYDAEDSDDALYRERADVTLLHGSFTAELGSLEPLDAALFDAHRELYLGITVEDDPEATPRMRLGQVPYASVAAFADNAKSVQGLDPSSLQRPLENPCTDNSALQSIDADGHALCQSFARPGVCPDGQWVYGSAPSGAPMCRSIAGQDPALAQSSAPNMLALINPHTPVKKGAWVSVTSQSISVPGPGVVLVIATAYANSNQNCTLQRCEPEPMRARAGIVVNQDDDPSIPYMFGTGDAQGGAAVQTLPLAITQAFPVTAAGRHTFYLKMRAEDPHHDDGFAGTGVLQLVYLPGTGMFVQ